MSLRPAESTQDPLPWFSAAWMVVVRFPEIVINPSSYIFKNFHLYKHFQTKCMYISCYFCYYCDMFPPSFPNLSLFMRQFLIYYLILLGFLLAPSTKIFQGNRHVNKYFLGEDEKVGTRTLTSNIITIIYS